MHGALRAIGGRIEQIKHVGTVLAIPERTLRRGRAATGACNVRTKIMSVIRETLERRSTPCVNTIGSLWSFIRAQVNRLPQCRLVGCMIDGRLKHACQFGWRSLQSVVLVSCLCSIERNCVDAQRGHEYGHGLVSISFNTLEPCCGGSIWRIFRKGCRPQFFHEEILAANPPLLSGSGLWT